jgi:NADH:ubiquinone oxidoreductase subunit K
MAVQEGVAVAALMVLVEWAGAFYHQAQIMAFRCLEIVPLAASMEILGAVLLLLIVTVMALLDLAAATVEGLLPLACLEMLFHPIKAALVVVAAAI